MAEKGQIAGQSKLEALSQMISGRANKGYTINGFSLISAEWDQKGAPVQYRFEIKLGSHPGENRYFASAPLPTDVHIALLEEQERLFS